MIESCNQQVPDKDCKLSIAIIVILLYYCTTKTFVHRLYLW